MKKLFYILLIAFTASVTITSCTQEEADPKPNTGVGGGGVSEG